MSEKHVDSRIEAARIVAASVIAQAAMQVRPDDPDSLLKTLARLSHLAQQYLADPNVHEAREED